MAKLKAKARKALPESAFALGGRRFPIHDITHARAALSMQRHASPSERATIRRKVKARFPSIDVSGVKKKLKKAIKDRKK